MATPNLPHNGKNSLVDSQIADNACDHYAVTLFKCHLMPQFKDWCVAALAKDPAADLGQVKAK